MSKKKDSLINGAPCEKRGAVDSKIYFGKRTLATRTPVQLVKCNACGKIMRAETDPHPLSRKLKDRALLLEILKDLVQGKSIRKTAAAHNSAPRTVVETEKAMQKFIRARLENIASETGLSVKDIAGLIQRIT